MDYETKITLIENMKDLLDKNTHQGEFNITIGYISGLFNRLYDMPITLFLDDEHLNKYNKIRK